jgi:hypothetical protein
LLAGREGRPMQGDFNQLVAILENVGCDLAGHMQEGVGFCCAYKYFQPSLSHQLPYF